MLRFLPVVSLIIFYTLSFTLARAQTNQTVNNGTVTQPITFSGPGCSYHWVNSNPAIGLAASGDGNIPSFTAVNNGSTPVTAIITAIPADNGFIYASNPYTNMVAVVNANTNAAVNYIRVQGGPSALSVSPDGSRLYVVNTESASVSVINTATQSVIATVGVGEYPYGIAVSPDGKTVYVTCQTSHSITVIDATTNAVRTTFTLPQYTPWGIVVSPDGTKLLVAAYGSNSISIVNASTGAVQSVAVGTTPMGVSVSSTAGLVYVTNFGSNNVSVVNFQTNSVVATIPVGGSPMGISVSPDGASVYVTNAADNTVSVIKTATNQVVATIPVGQIPEGISTSPDGSLVYVFNTNDGTMSVISTASNSVIATGNVSNGQYSMGTFVAGCSPVSFNITVNSAPSLSTTAATGNISACAGSASASPLIAQFSVSSNGLSAGPVANAPAGFEVSLSSASGYASQVTLTTSNTQTVYVRSAASAPVGLISGQVTVTAPGAATQHVAVSGTVNALSTANSVSNQSAVNGNTTQPVTFSGTANTFTWVNDTPGIGLPSSGTGNIAAFAAINTGSVPVVATITVTPKSSPLAYIANGQDATISVINTVTNQVVTTIGVGNAPTGVSVSPDNRTVYVADDNDNKVSVINTATNTVTNTITVGQNPPSLRVTPDGRQLWVVNTNSLNISVINTTTNAIIKTIPLTARPVNITISKDGSRVYVTDFANAVEVIDTSTGTVIANVAVGDEPLLLAVTPDGKRVYVANYLDGNVSVIDAGTNTVIQTIQVEGGPEGVVFSADGSTVYVTNRLSNTVSVISTATNTVTQTIAVNQGPAGVALNADGTLLYVENIDSQNVSVINTATNQIISTVQVGNHPISVGNFIQDDGNCDGTPVTFKMTIYPTTIPPSITVSGDIAAMNTIYGTPSLSSAFTVSAVNLTTGVQINPPANFEISTDNVNFSRTLTLGSAGNLTATTVYIRLPATSPVGNYSGNVMLSSAGAANVSYSVPNSIVGPAALVVSANDIHKTYGTALTGGTGSVAFTTTGLQNNETIGTVTISYGSGSLATDPAGSYSTSVTASQALGGTFSASNYTLSYSAAAIVVDAAPLTISAQDQSKIVGTDNPPLTLSYVGFKNNEDPSVLVPLPTVSTPATLSSPVGKYSIDVTGGADQNYNITRLSGILTVLPVSIQLQIPNTFTPNGDGINDTWNIKNIENYPDVTVNVFTRWGQKVFSSIGYPVPWDGSYKGYVLPSGTYYYIIDTKGGQAANSGWITIIR